MPVVPTTPPIIPVSEIVDETRRHLLGGSRSELNKLSGAMSVADPSLSCVYDISGITRGGFLGIDDEIVYVWATTPASRQITAMERGMRGTTPAAHANGTLIEVNPRFPLATVRWALREEIRSWGPQLHQVMSAIIPLHANVRGYDLTALGDFYQILDVRVSNQITVGATNPQSWPKVLNWQFIRDADSTVFPSGNAITIPTYPTSPLPSLYVLYAAPFDVDTSFADDVDLIGDVGLSATMVDIAPIGAAWRLLQMQEIKRTTTQTQGEPADYQDVPPNYIGAAAARLKKMRDDRISDEILRLMARVSSAGWG